VRSCTPTPVAACCFSDHPGDERRDLCGRADDPPGDAVEDAVADFADGVADRFPGAFAEALFSIAREPFDVGTIPSIKGHAILQNVLSACGLALTPAFVGCPAWVPAGATTARAHGGASASAAGITNASRIVRRSADIAYSAVP
jgi:hypothetical protein